LGSIACFGSHCRVAYGLWFWFAGIFTHQKQRIIKATFADAQAWPIARRVFLPAASGGQRQSIETPRGRAGGTGDQVHPNLQLARPTVAQVETRFAAWEAMPRWP